METTTFCILFSYQLLPESRRKMIVMLRGMKLINNMSFRTLRTAECCANTEWPVKTSKSSGGSIKNRDNVASSSQQSQLATRKFRRPYFTYDIIILIIYQKFEVECENENKVESQKLLSNS